MKYNKYVRNLFLFTYLYEIIKKNAYVILEQSRTVIRIKHKSNSNYDFFFENNCAFFLFLKYHILYVK